jgi:hypothetical protein
VAESGGKIGELEEVRSKDAGAVVQSLERHHHGHVDWVPLSVSAFGIY